MVFNIVLKFSHTVTHERSIYGKEYYFLNNLRNGITKIYLQFKKVLSFNNYKHDKSLQTHK